jgi:hypothetical protein
MAVSILTGAILMAPHTVAADFFGPPLFVPSDDEFRTAAFVCAGLQSKNEHDEVFGLYAENLFYRSANHAVEIDGKTYFKTYFVNTSNDPECIGELLTRGQPVYGSSVSSKADPEFDTLMLRVPGGQAEVTRSGDIIIR